MYLLTQISTGKKAQSCFELYNWCFCVILHLKFEKNKYYLFAKTNLFYYLISITTDKYLVVAVFLPLIWALYQEVSDLVFGYYTTTTTPV